MTVVNTLGTSAKAVRSVALTGAPWLHVGYLTSDPGNIVTVFNQATNVAIATIPVGLTRRTLW